MTFLVGDTTRADFLEDYRLFKIRESAPGPKGVCFYGSFSNTWNSTVVYAETLTEAVEKLRAIEAELPKEWGRKLQGVYRPTPPFSEKCADYLVRFQYYDSLGIVSW